MEKQTESGRLRELCSINQFQLRTKGGGVKKCETFADVIDGSSLIWVFN